MIVGENRAADTAPLPGKSPSRIIRKSPHSSLGSVMMSVFAQVLLVLLGSTVGGLTRWGVSLACAHWFGRAFPWGTLIINVSGCLFLGWLITAVNARRALDEDWTETAKAIELMLAV